MRRHLVLAIVAVVTGALLVAGLGTLVLERHAAARAARVELRSQARALARATELAIEPGMLARIRVVARLDGAEVVRLSPQGVPARPLPSGLASTDLHLGLLGSGQVESGSQGSVAFAAVRLFPMGRPDGRLILVITRRFSGPVNGGVLLALAIGATLGVSVLVATWLARRITRPLEAAVRGTERVAAGELDVEVPVAPDSYPELASLARSINAMVASLSRSRGLERQFLMSVSHDLRTPLTSIRGFAEAIADGTVADPLRAAGVITAEARRLERLVQDLLELARLESRHFSLETRPFEVSEVVAETAEGFRPLVDGAGLELAILVEDGLWVSADPDRLAQMLANLIENAYKFATRRVTVRAERRQERVVVTVTDDGPGIPWAEQALVFDRSYTSTRTPTRPAGSGLGLAIVAELARAMGIEIGRSAPASGVGTEIVLDFGSQFHPDGPSR